MTNIELRVDVSSAVPELGGAEIAATVHLPEPADMGADPVVMYASPGGGFSRRYFDMHFAGHEGYSQAEYHTARGMVVVAYDHLGTGDSTVPAEALTIEAIAAANHAAVRSIHQQIEQGTFGHGLQWRGKAACIGVGQSMGGCLTIVMQGRHRTFDAIAPLGYSAIHTVPPLKDPEKRRGLMAATGSLNRQTDVRTLSIPDRTSAHTENDMTWCHHWEDVPRDIVKADTPEGYAFRRHGDWPPPWRSAALPACALIMMSPGCVAEEAAAITVPVLTAMGERDVCPDPHAEPGAYRGSRDVSLFIAPGMAHMHNFATTRELFWRRLDQWSRRVSGG